MALPPYHPVPNSRSTYLPTNYAASLKYTNLFSPLNNQQTSPIRQPHVKGAVHHKYLSRCLTIICTWNHQHQHQPSTTPPPQKPHILQSPKHFDILLDTWTINNRSCMFMYWSLKKGRVYSIIVRFLDRRKSVSW